MTSSVLHLLAPSPVGGLEAVVENLARGQRRRGADARVGAVVEPDARPHPFVSRLRSAEVPVAPLVVPHRAYLTEARAVRELIGRVDPDLVHTHGYRCDVVAATVARRTARPVVSTVHGFTGGGGKNRVYEWLQRRSLARLDAVVAVSGPLAAELRAAGVPADRVHAIRNAWSSDTEPRPRREARGRLGLPEEAFVVGWVGRLSREKGADVLLEALARTAEGTARPDPPRRNADAANAGPDPGSGRLVASIVGDGAQLRGLRELADRLGISGRVTFHGRVPDAATLYRAFDVFALSSRTEGTPISLFEAMEAGVPVVAARVGGVPDVVTEEEALLVPPEDPPALARALEAVRRDPATAEARARRARLRLREEFAVEPWLDRYEEIYRGVLDRRDGGAAS